METDVALGCRVRVHVAGATVAAEFVAELLEFSGALYGKGAQVDVVVGEGMTEFSMMAMEAHSEAPMEEAKEAQKEAAQKEEPTEALTGKSLKKMRPVLEAIADKATAAGLRKVSEELKVSAKPRHLLVMTHAIAMMHMAVQLCSTIKTQHGRLR